MTPIILLPALWLFVSAFRTVGARIAQRALNSSSKAGLAWPNDRWVDIEQYRTTGKVSWYYTWSPWSIDTSLEFVPMLSRLDTADQFSAMINQIISQRKISNALGMNEPQQGGQANITAQQGVDIWRARIEPLKARGIRLGSPAPSSAPNGKTWLLDFFKLCAGRCSVDFIALHWYGVNATEFKTYLVDFHQTFMRPIWVSEWACQNFVDLKAQCSPDDVVRFMRDTQEFMDTTEWVERYAWFGAMENLQGVNEANALMDKSGRINALGRQYIGANGTSNGSTSLGGATVISSSPLAWIVYLSALWIYM